MSDDVIEQDDDNLSKETTGLLSQEVTDDSDTTGGSKGEPAAPPTLEDLEPEIPVPTEITGEIYNAFKENFGADQAELLQKRWGDKAVQNEGVVRAVMKDNSPFNEIYAEHQSDDGGISVQGLQAAAEYLTKEAGFNDLDELSKAWPELDAIILENYDERTGTISAVGIYQALAYIGQRSGYKFTYREQRT